MRIFAWLLQVLIALDQLLYVLIGGIFYLAGRGECPSASHTISYSVGKAAMENKPWALVCEFIINALFLIVGERDHCRNSVRKVEE